MNNRISALLKNRGGEIPLEHGVCIDAYNQTWHKDWFVTIQTGVGCRNMHFVIVEDGNKEDKTEKTKQGRI